MCEIHIWYKYKGSIYYSIFHHQNQEELVTVLCMDKLCYSALLTLRSNVKICLLLTSFKSPLEEKSEKVDTVWHGYSLCMGSALLYFH